MSTTFDTVDALDSWVDAMAGGGGPYRTAPPIPYTRTRNRLRRAEERLALAERAYRRMRSPYLQDLPEHQDLANTSRIAREYQEARQEVQTLRTLLNLAIDRLRPRLEQLRRWNPNWPGPMPWARQLRNLFRRRR
jgi:hypothetical protein